MKLLTVSMYGDIYFVCGIFSELHFGIQLSPNRGETVLYCEKISWTQDMIPLGEGKSRAFI